MFLHLYEMLLAVHCSILSARVVQLAPQYNVVLLEYPFN
jgi:hypothetical protein